MGAYKDEKRGTWYANFYYTDFDGKKKAKLKRGFATRREALEFEREFLGKHLGNKPDMLFKDFVNEVYLPYVKQRTKQVTYDTALTFINTNILPSLGEFRLCEIDNAKVIQWQNNLMNYRNRHGEPYAPATLRAIHGRLSAILNFAVRNYGLEKNPCVLVGPIGSCESETEMLFWTPDEYEKFRKAIEENVTYFVFFEILYWSGMRKGEALALTFADIDFEKCTISINKTYHKIKGEDVVTDPKTPNAVRTVKVPKFLIDEISKYKESLGEVKPKQRLFNLCVSTIGTVLEKYALLAGVKRIRVHDLRHSHVSLLISKGFSAVDIGKRVGHAAVEITYRYSHLFPHVEDKIASTLEDIHTTSSSGDNEDKTGSDNDL